SISIWNSTKVVHRGRTQSAAFLWIVSPSSARVHTHTLGTVSIERDDSQGGGTHHRRIDHKGRPPISCS
ncbi:unnamed protein product, partial [Musa acuminata var. zebrina]